MNFQQHKKQLLQDPAFKCAYDESALEYQIARAFIQARMKKGYTQNELATKLHTKQSAISRVENAKTIPSLSFLKRAASAFDASLQVKFKF